MARESTGDWLREHGRTVAVLLVMGIGGALAVRWIVVNRSAGPPPRKVMQFAVVNVQPEQRPPPPKPEPERKPVEEAEPEREVKAVQLPPDAPPPPAAPAAGPLALAGAGDGPGDAFNLAGNPGGRGLLSGGGLGDGSGVSEDPATRYAWYYARMQPDLQSVLQRSKRLTSLAIVAELRLWWDETGLITRVQPVRPSADPTIDEEFQRLVGVRLRHPPPPDIPMPVVMRINARRPT